MNNQCKYFRRRTKTINKKRTIYLYCTKNKEEIQYSNCKNCPYKEYKNIQKLQKNCELKEKNAQKIHKNCAIQEKKAPKINNKSAKLRKLERNRFSLFSDDHDHCIICGSTYQLTWHEIFGGRNRLNSMRYGLCLRICLSCHEMLQNDKNFNDFCHKKGQSKFNEAYPDLQFKDIFKKNYL